MSSEPSDLEWTFRVRQAYLGGETSVFVLHMNVFDRVLHEGRFLDFTDYLADVLLGENKQNVLVYTPSVGVRIVRGQPQVRAIDELSSKRSPTQLLPVLEAVLLSTDSTALIVPYAEMLVPPGEVNLLSEQDRASVVALHRWSLSADLARKDSVVFLLSESLSEIHPKLIANPRIAAVEVPLPCSEARERVVRLCDPSLSDELARRLSAQSAGLKAVQIAGLLTPRLPTDLDESARKSFIEGLLGGEAQAATRAEKLATLTRGMSHGEIQKLLKPGVESTQAPSEDATLLAALAQRKREIIERECAGLIEFIEPRHGLSAVGGMDGVKAELMQVAQALSLGDVARCPMGMLFVGPMGCGKTFVANAFIKESGLSAVRLKNFRSKWVGSTEANLDKVLGMVRALGPIVLVIDEGDRALADSGENDGGTGSRVVARLKEFMSVPENRGVVLVILMTNRPDKLDVDMKRAGRLDKKIPFFYPERAEDVEAVLRALIKRHAVGDQVDLVKARGRIASQLIGYSNADLEAVVLLAHELAVRAGEPIGEDVLARAVEDYVPSRDVDMLEYMELLAAFEASRRSLLPERLRGLSSEELSQRLKEKRASIRA